MNKQQIDKEFHEVCKALISQGDLDCIEDAIPYKTKKEFIKGFKEENGDIE